MTLVTPSILLLAQGFLVWGFCSLVSSEDLFWGVYLCLSVCVSLCMCMSVCVCAHTCLGGEAVLGMCKGKEGTSMFQAQYILFVPVANIS